MPSFTFLITYTSVWVPDKTGFPRARFSVFERYSMAGGNRVSLSILFAERDGYVDVTGVSSGGSQAVFWKINTVGEEAFIKKLDELLAAHPAWTA